SIFCSTSTIIPEISKHTTKGLRLKSKYRGLLSKWLCLSRVATGELYLCHNSGMNPIKLPEDCSSLGEIRAEIDRIDRSIVRAIGERRRYVIAAAKFKRSAGDVS